MIVKPYFVELKETLSGIMREQVLKSREIERLEGVEKRMVGLFGAWTRPGRRFKRLESSAKMCFKTSNLRSLLC